MTTELFTTAPVVPPAKERPAHRGPIHDRMEQHFRDHRYESFTTLELYDLFHQDKPQAIRNALRKMFHEKLIKATGEHRYRRRAYTDNPAIDDSDTACLTLSIGK